MMSFSKELRIAPVWELKPQGVQRIINQLKCCEFPMLAIIMNQLQLCGHQDAEFLFEPEYNWFQIFCRVEDAPKIKKTVRKSLEEIEKEVIGKDEFLINDDLALLKPMRNPWIGLLPAEGRSQIPDRAYLEFRLPSIFKLFPVANVWRGLASRPQGLGLSDIITKEQFDELQLQSNVTLAHNPTGTEVYIGAQSQEDLVRVTVKLDNLLDSKRLSQPKGTHIAYTEGYKDHALSGITIDARFLANIDEALVASTFLDLKCDADIGNGYELLVEAITLRVCRWDERLLCHTSLIGPKIKGRRSAARKVGKRRYKMPGRTSGSNTILKTATKWTGPSKKQRKPQTVNLDAAYGGADIQKWLDHLEGAATATTTPSKETDTDAVSATTDHKSKDELISIAGSVIHETNLKGHFALMNIPENTALDYPVLGPPNGIMDIQAVKLTDNKPLVLSSTNGDSTPPSNPMRTSLIPTANGQVQNASKKPPAKSTGKESAPTGQVVELGNAARTPGPRGSMKGQTSTKSNSEVAGRNPKGKEVARPEVANQQFAPWFSAEVTRALGRLMAKGPFLRGKVNLHVHLGRIMITGMDYTAVAFNGPGTPSNGWEKDRLLHILNRQSPDSGQGVFITRILTQDGEDIEDIIETVTDLSTGKPLWENEPTQRVVYSFTCAAENEEFFLDVEADDGADGGFNYNLRTREDQKPPIWIHGVLRNWDAQIVLSHSRTHELEAKYGEFAKSFVACILLNFPQDGWPQMQVGVHKGFKVRPKLMRIRTTFRFPSTDEQSYLDIVEVEETACKPCEAPTEEAGPMEDPKDWLHLRINPLRDTAAIRKSEDLGSPTFWYEASVGCLAVDEFLGESQTLAFGDRAAWDYNTLLQAGAIDHLVKPALRTLQMIDWVGAHNDNKQLDKLTLPPGNGEAIPGEDRFERTTPIATPTLRPTTPQGKPAATHPASFVQTTPPPGTVLARPRVPIPAASVTVSPAGGRNVQARRAVPSDAGSFLRPVANGGFSIVGARNAGNLSQRGRNQAPSTTSSTGSRGPIPSFRPPSQFW